MFCTKNSTSTPGILFNSESTHCLLFNTKLYFHSNHFSTTLPISESSILSLKIDVLNLGRV